MNKLKPKPVRAIASQEFPPVAGTGAITEQGAIDAAKNKEVISAASAEPPLPEQNPEVITLTAEQLQSAIQAAIASATEKANQDADRVRQEIQS